MPARNAARARNRALNRAANVTRRRLLESMAATAGLGALGYAEWLNITGHFDHRRCEVDPHAADSNSFLHASDPAQAALLHVGHSTHLLHLAGVRLLTDPWFYDPGHGGMWHARGPAFAPETLGALDIVLITHEHPDHADPRALDRFDKRALVVVSTKYLASLARQLGYGHVELLLPWQTLEHAGTTISAVPAVHDIYEVGYVIERAGHRVYFAGDTSLHPAMDAIAERFMPTTAILPVDGTRLRGDPRLVMDPADAVIATQKLRPSLVVPSHSDSYFADPVLSLYATQVEHAATKFGKALAAARPATRCALLPVGGHVQLTAAQS